MVKLRIVRQKYKNNYCQKSFQIVINGNVIRIYYLLIPE